MSDERAEAIRIIEDSRRTHVEWIEYLAKFGDDLRPHEEIAGDAAHHREAVEGYDLVLRVLRLVPSPPPGEPESEKAMTGDPKPPHVTQLFKAGDLWGWGCTCRASDGTHETRALAVQGADWHKVHGVAGRCACGFPERHTNLPCSR